MIEDKASGQQLIQTRRASIARGVPNPIARLPQQDKFSRVAGVSAMVEAGQLLLPHEAAWLAEFRSELLTCPNGRFDDQADVLAQLLEWVRQRLSTPEPMIAGPIICRCAGAQIGGWRSF